ncbi:MAG: hypothetical protein L0G87_13780 [Renibacterium salmoninarum]|jgi:hypothetical protein|nr:hypothetical protein [Renibacterium salmoninarum]
MTPRIDNEDFGTSEPVTVPAPRRTRTNPWWWIVLVLLVIGLVAAFLAGRSTSPAPSTGQPPASASTEPSTSALTTPGQWDAVVPQGCLAGTNQPTTAQFLAAAPKAGQSTAGAVSFAGLYAQYAWATPREAKSVRLAGVDAGVSATVGDAEQKYAKFGEGQWAGDTGNLARSLQEARYVINSEAADKVTVTITTPKFKDGNPVKNDQDQTNVGTTEFTVVFEAGQWRVTSVTAKPTDQSVLSTGATFAGAC